MEGVVGLFALAVLFGMLGGGSRKAQRAEPKREPRNEPPPRTTEPSRTTRRQFRVNQYGEIDE